LMNYVFTRHNNGVYVLRVEDTDMERSTGESERRILEDLLWLGIEWDEGPDKDGGYGPYRQSERTALYNKYADALIRQGAAYLCYCTPEELEQRRKERIAKGEPAAYDGRCRKLSRQEKARFEQEGRKPVIRFRVDADTISYTDAVKGEITFPDRQIGDFVIVRANGMPMYNFSCAIDDHLMQISHVIRGDDHVSNTPRQILLYQALGWDIPVFMHIPMILGQDGARLSKRHGATSVAQYRDQGFLPETMTNFLSLLAWSPAGDREIFTIEDVINEFDPGRVSHSAAVFNTEKLRWMNGMYIRSLSEDRLAAAAFPYFKARGYPVSGTGDIRAITASLQQRAETLADMALEAEFFFADTVQPHGEEEEAVMNLESSPLVLREFAREVRQQEQWDGGVFVSVVKSVSKATGVKGKNLWMPVRIALTGSSHGPELGAVIEIFGKEKCARFAEKAAAV